MGQEEATFSKPHPLSSSSRHKNQALRALINIKLTSMEKKVEYITRVNSQCTANSTNKKIQKKTPEEGTNKYLKPRCERWGKPLCPVPHVNQTHLRIPLCILHPTVWFYVNVNSYYDTEGEREREKYHSRIVFYCVVVLNLNCVVVGLPLLTD